jgi:hypothetical protein
MNKFFAHPMAPWALIAAAAVGVLILGTVKNLIFGKSEPTEENAGVESPFNKPTPEGSW